MSDDRAALGAAVARLEALTGRLGEDGVGADELETLAQEALAASARVTELLPRVIREIERAAQGGPLTETPPDADI